VSEAQEREVVTPVPDSNQDPLLYRIIVISLAVAALLTIVGGIVLAFVGKEIPASIIAIGAAAAGALGGVLMPRTGVQ
jgi:hypothetical protein